MPKHRSVTLHQQLIEAEQAERREAMDFYAAKIADQDNAIEALTTMRDARATRLNTLLDSVTRQVTETVADMRQNDADMFDQLVTVAQATREEMAQRLDELEGTDRARPRPVLKDFAKDEPVVDPHKAPEIQEAA